MEDEGGDVAERSYLLQPGVVIVVNAADVGAGREIERGPIACRQHQIDCVLAGFQISKRQQGASPTGLISIIIILASNLRAVPGRARGDTGLSMLVVSQNHPD